MDAGNFDTGVLAAGKRAAEKGVDVDFNATAGSASAIAFDDLGIDLADRTDACAVNDDRGGTRGMEAGRRVGLEPPVGQPQLDREGLDDRGEVVDADVPVGLVRRAYDAARAPPRGTAVRAARCCPPRAV